MFGEIKAHVFADGERIEQRAGLKHHRQPVMLQHLGRLDGFAVNEDFPGIRLIQADDMLEQNAFAAAARAHDDKDLAGLDFKIHALEHLLAAEGLCAGR